MLIMLLALCMHMKIVGRDEEVTIQPGVDLPFGILGIFLVGRGKCGSAAIREPSKTVLCLLKIGWAVTP